mgnify:CR=1 FL=1
MMLIYREIKQNNETLKNHFPDKNTKNIRDTKLKL